MMNTWSVEDLGGRVTSRVDCVGAAFERWRFLMLHDTKPESECFGPKKSSTFYRRFLSQDSIMF